jgi:hypothetical protein
VDRGGEPAKIALGLLKLTVPFRWNLKQIDKADAKSLYESSAATDYRAAVTVSACCSTSLATAADPY